MTRVSVPERGLETLFGNQDENLRFLEETFKVRIRNHGSDLLIEGDERGSALAGQVFEQLGALMKDGYSVASADVRLAAELLSRDGETRLRDYLMKSAVRGGKRWWCRAASTSARTSSRSRRTTWSSGSGPRAPARPTWRWRRPSRTCSTSR